MDPPPPPPEILTSIVFVASSKTKVLPTPIKLSVVTPVPISCPADCIPIEPLTNEPSDFLYSRAVTVPAADTFEPTKRSPPVVVIPPEEARVDTPTEEKFPPTLKSLLAVITPIASTLDTSSYVSTPPILTLLEKNASLENVVTPVNVAPLPKRT